VNRPDDKDNANRCFETLLKEGKKAGCFPYRLPISAMETLPQQGRSFWHLAETLKAAVDPLHLLSPGRYGL
jgi:hypothetical protein